MRKIKRVIAKGTLVGDPDLHDDRTRIKLDESDIEDYPEGTPFKIVALLEPEKKLIRPNLATWLFDLNSSNTQYLSVQAGIAARIFLVPGHERWSYAIGDTLVRDVSEPYHEARAIAERALADAGLCGFGWEVESELPDIGARLDAVIAACKSTMQSTHCTYVDLARYGEAKRILKIAKGEEVEQ